MGSHVGGREWHVVVDEPSFAQNEAARECRFADAPAMEGRVQFLRDRDAIVDEEGSTNEG